MMNPLILSMCLVFSFTLCYGQSEKAKKNRTQVYTVMTEGMDYAPDIMLDVVMDRDPDEDYMNLSVSGAHIAAGFNVELTDHAGNLIEHYYIRELFTVIPVGQLPAGTYYLRIVDGFDLIKVFIVRKEPK